MWLQLQYTFARNSSFAGIAAGKYDNIRLMSGDSQSSGLTPSVPPTHPWRRIRDAASLPASDEESLDTFSAPCYHFAEALTDQFVAAGRQPPTLGLLNMAIGGSMIEEWVTNDVVSGAMGAGGRVLDGAPTPSPVLRRRKAALGTRPLQTTTSCE